MGLMCGDKMRMVGGLYRIVYAAGVVMEAGHKNCDFATQSGQRCCMHRRFVLTVVGLAIIPFVIATVGSTRQGKKRKGRHPRARSFSEKLQASVPRFEAAGRSMAELAVQMAFRYRLPMAIEYLDRNALRMPLHLKMKDQTARQVMASIVGLVPGYRVDFSQGLVDIYSPSARSDISNPLNIVIRRYDVNGLDTHLADSQLLCVLGQQINPHSGCGGSVAPGQWGPLKITLHLESKRVYEVLNAIVAQNGAALWAPVARPVGPSRMLTNFWYIYPLDPPFQRTILDRFQ